MKNITYLLVFFICFSACNIFSDTEEVKTYHPNGKLLMTGMKVHNKKEGRWVYYNENGNIEEEYHYKSNSLHGVRKSYTDGKLNSEMYYEWGRNEGPTIKYDPENGKIIMKGQFEKGKMTGTWYFYNSNGDLIEKRWYEDDKMVKSEDLISKEVHEFK